MVHAAEIRTRYSGIRSRCLVVFKCFKRSTVKFPWAAATETSIFHASCRLLSIMRHEIQSDIRLLRDHAMERDPRLQSGVSWREDAVHTVTLNGNSFSASPHVASLLLRNLCFYYGVDWVYHMGYLHRNIVYFMISIFIYERLALLFCHNAG